MGHWETPSRPGTAQSRVSRPGTAHSRGALSSSSETAPAGPEITVPRIEPIVPILIPTTKPELPIVYSPPRSPSSRTSSPSPTAGASAAAHRRSSTPQPTHKVLQKSATFSGGSMTRAAAAEAEAMGAAGRRSPHHGTGSGGGAAAAEKELRRRSSMYAKGMVMDAAGHGHRPSLTILNDVSQFYSSNLDRRSEEEAALERKASLNWSEDRARVQEMLQRETLRFHPTLVEAANRAWLMVERMFGPRLHKAQHVTDRHTHPPLTHPFFPRL